MMPYFDKEKLKRKIISEYGINLTYNDVCQALKKLPDEDVKPIVHAHWKETEYEGQPVSDVFECSNCGEESYIDAIEELFAYCPNCGAKMDEKEEEIKNDKSY